MNSDKKFWIKKGVGFVVCFLAFSALVTWVVMMLWNIVLVPVLGVSIITFWQALGILVLSKILFGGFRKGVGGGWGNRGPWQKNLKDKWCGMSNEERENFKNEWRNKCQTWGRKNKPFEEKEKA